VDIFNAWLSFAQPFYNTTDFEKVNFLAGIPFPGESTKLFLDVTHSFLLLPSCHFVFLSSNTSSSLAEVSNFIQDNTNWVKSMASSTNTTNYAIQVSLVLKQLDGIVDGYNAYAPDEERLSYWDFVAWQLQVFDIEIQFALILNTNETVVFLTFLIFVGRVG